MGCNSFGGGGGGRHLGALCSAMRQGMSESSCRRRVNFYLGVSAKARCACGRAKMRCPIDDCGERRGALEANVSGGVSLMLGMALTPDTLATELHSPSHSERLRARRRSACSSRRLAVACRRSRPQGSSAAARRSCRRRSRRSRSPRSGRSGRRPRGSARVFP